MPDQAADLVFQYFKTQNLRGLQGIRHHLDKNELQAGTVQLLADIADHLHALGFDGKSKPLDDGYREMLLELATLIGPVAVLLGTQRNAPIAGDYELVRCLLNQLAEHQDELIVEQIPSALMNSQFNVGMLLVRFYLHKLPAGRKPERKLTAMELYQAFEALDDVVPFNSQGNEELAALEITRLMLETGYVHNVLYRAQTGKFVPSQSFYNALNLLKPAEQQFLKKFHARKKA
ncbi:hypothetical protein [Pseudomonas putida]|jgi:hypothetical protein|uniref:hypothetical protein n=1 Tax=Pseudomonas putida TaxID=303 RepID=UPI000CD42D9C|nr:hypothetical protein [Pseudomonas putida]POF92840.1 hypothetical protein BGP83_09110 [Pseudomonas putida]